MKTLPNPCSSNKICDRPWTATWQAGMSRGIGVFVFSRGSPEEPEEFPSLTCGPMTARSTCQWEWSPAFTAEKTHPRSCWGIQCNLGTEQ